MEPQTPPEPAPPTRTRHRTEGGIGKKAGIVVAILVVYFGSLFAYWWFSASSQELTAGDLGNGSETVVLVTLQSIRTVDFKVDAKVLVIPEDSLTDERLDVLKTDISVRLYPWNSVGDLNFPEGEAPKEVTTTLDIDGDPTRWPFDSYHTPPISATLLVGSGADRQFRPARVEFEGAIQGWNISSQDTAPSPLAANSGAAEELTFKRALGTLAFDLGICLVLITLPTLAVFTALQVTTRKKEFQMPFTTWYAAMLFAIVPLRNILPGAPPPGAWIDQILILWVIIALVAAMVIYIRAWYKQVP